ncbi:MAG: hypothetical protein GC182_09155 [Rhodopseudomonas sp.]|nr:hypothetical protein [Rhodopseudomonas sp.]
MRCLSLLAVLALVGALGGCATDVGPSADELKARWESENVYPQNYKTDLLAFLRTYLNEPDHVRDAQVSQPVRKTVGPGERFVACVRYRTRDVTGKYGAPKDGVATYVSGRLDRFLDTPPQVKAMCTDVPLQPFPELEKLSR